MDGQFGWKAATDQRPASLSAISKPSLMSAEMLCLPEGIASSSPLDPSLTADVQCWKLWMSDISYGDIPPNDRAFLSSINPNFLVGAHQNQPIVSELSKNTMEGAYTSPTEHVVPFGFQEEPTSCRPATSSQNSFSPSPNTSDVQQNHLFSFQGFTSWQVTATNESTVEVYAPFLTSEVSMIAPNPNPSRSTSIVGGLSNMFMFGSPGVNAAFFNLGYTPAAEYQPPQDERPNFTWTEVNTKPASSLLSPVRDSEPQWGGPAASTSLQSDIGIITTIHLDTPPSLPRLNDAPPKIEELTTTFETSPGMHVAKGKRKPFDPEEREKVKKVRRIGACFSCRAKKVSCTEGEVCSRCLTAAQDPLLACQVCLRNKFKDIYIGVKDIHASLHAREGQVKDILASLTGTPQQVVIWVGGGPSTAKLQLDVMQCQSSARCRWKCLRKVNGIYITSHAVEDQRYAIVPTSMPSIEKLDLFGRQILSFSAGSHSGAVTPLLDAFLLQYCRPGGDSRLYHLADATVRIASLNGLVAYGFVNLHDGSYDLLSRPPSHNQRYVSETIHDQIRLRAAEGFGKTEKYLFNTLDNLREITGPNDHNRIVAGICLMRLMILYRERMVRDEIRLGLPRHGKRRTGHEGRLEKAAFMYKRLTVVYSTLCSGNNSPMSMGWQSASGGGIREDDEVLKRALSRLQAAFRTFCNERLTQRHDDVFKRLIVEPARRSGGRSGR